MTALYLVRKPDGKVTPVGGSIDAYLRCYPDQEVVAAVALEGSSYNDIEAAKKAFEEVQPIDEPTPEKAARDKLRHEVRYAFPTSFWTRQRERRVLDRLEPAVKMLIEAGRREERRFIMEAIGRLGYTNIKRLLDEEGLLEEVRSEWEREEDREPGRTKRGSIAFMEDAPPNTQDHEGQEAE